MLRALSAIAVLLISACAPAFAELHIHHMTVHADTLFIHGSFGGDSGLVIVDGQTKQPLSWSDSLIKLSSIQGYAFKVVRGIDTSNTRWLTRWQIGASFLIAYVKHPGEWTDVSTSFTEVGDISSYLLEPGMPAEAHFGSLTIVPGDRYDFDHQYLRVTLRDTAILRPDNSHAEIDPRQPPWYYVKDIRGGIYQQDAPPDSILPGAPYPSRRVPFRDHIAAPEDSLVFSWSPAAGATLHRFQLTLRDSLIADTLLNSPRLVMWELLPNSTFAWRVKGSQANGDNEWSSWWPFTTRRLDRVQPVFLVTTEPYAITVTFVDTGRYRSGLKAVLLENYGNGIPKVIPGPVIRSECTLDPLSIRVEQVDTTLAINCVIDATDCDENTTFYYLEIPGHEVVQPAETKGQPSMARLERSLIVSRGAQFIMPTFAESYRATLFDVAGSKSDVQPSVTNDHLSFSTVALTPGLYFLVLTNKRETIPYRILVIHSGVH